MAFCCKARSKLVATQCAKVAALVGELSVCLKDGDEWNAAGIRREIEAEKSLARLIHSHGKR